MTTNLTVNSLTPSQRNELRAIRDGATVDGDVCESMPRLCWRACGVVGHETYRLTDDGERVLALLEPSYEAE